MINKYLLREMNLAADGDPWGDVQMWRFAFAHVLYHCNDAPASWDYRHQACGGFEYEEDMALIGLVNGYCTVAEVIHASGILTRAARILEAMGRSY